jgi:hypothetical protein
VVPFYRIATEFEEHTVSQIDRTREHLIETYRKKAKHYDITSRLYPRARLPSAGTTPPGRTSARPSRG